MGVEQDLEPLGDAPADHRQSSITMLLLTY